MAQLGTVLSGNFARRVKSPCWLPTCGIVEHPTTPQRLPMLRQLLSITQTAERLRVRPEFVRELVAKKRLTFIQGEQLDAAEVQQLAALMDKLRQRGIATLVEITAQGPVEN